MELSRYKFSTVKLSRFLVFSHLFLALAFFVSNGKTYMVGNNPHHRRETLDTEGKFQLEWLVDRHDKKITFTITAETTGYVGFGLTPHGKMTGADIMIGGVDSKGKSYLADYHAVGQQTPVLDPRQNYNLLSARENRTHTTISFSRGLDTCDAQDFAITEDKVSLIWALGSSDKISYHYGNRGIFHVHLLDPDYSPQIITEPGTGAQRALDQFGNIDESIRTWTINREMTVPTQETTYWCTMHKSPRLRRKNHMIGYRVRPNTEPSLRHLHHLAFYQCHRPRDGPDSNVLYEPFIGLPGENCLTAGAQVGTIPIQYCREFKQPWAAGSRVQFEPPHVGLSFLSEDYYIVQLHLDNPSLVANARVNISIDVFYTEKLRPNEGGYVHIRQEVPGVTPSFLIPPFSVDHEIRGICGAACTREMLPPEGISIYGGLLHTHNAGRKVRIRHFRNNKELPYIASDENYYFYFQQNRIFAEERRILPGDQLVAECVFDSTAANGTVVGGFSTSQEMCTMHMMHYQRLDTIMFCDSEIDSSEYLQYFLAGVRNITWSNDLIEYVVNPPHPLAGKVISEVSNNYVDWTLKRRQELRTFQLRHSHLSRCVPEAWTLGRGETPAMFPRVKVYYPFGAKPYEPPKQCVSNL